MTIEALTTNLHNPEITVEIQENPYEGVTELQLLAPPNVEIAELIKIYNQHQLDIINYLHLDKNDFMFKLSNIASIVKRLNGSFKVEYLGDNDGTLISIILPRNKQIE